MSIDAESRFHEVIDSFARLDSLALRIQRDVFQAAPGGEGAAPVWIAGLTVSVTLNDVGAAKRLVVRHRLVAGPRSPLELSRTWCGWLPEASRRLPVSVHVTLVPGG
ncbi:hypothetical protein [Myceligenerans xiligouense]|uniref:Uncharacterized protein n=1 Tax=Myceligenerans xiligouense TaxID=253184 RepID=A0A3N4YRM3_9MICO|nr:hypothetical protein [Myceligenerans xiligouense]RPF22837.1 hypothetical protein EDD34_3512 [Myceligenerans xiligouense]